MEKKHTFVEKLTDILIKQGSITDKMGHDLKEQFYNRSKEAFDYFLLEEGLVSREDILKALSEYYQVPALDTEVPVSAGDDTGYFFDHNLLMNFPEDFLVENVIIPVRIDQDILTILANEPDKPGLREKIGEYSSYVTEFRVGLKQDIIDAIREYYDESITYIDDITDSDEVEKEVIEEGYDLEKFSDEEDRW